MPPSIVLFVPLCSGGKIVSYLLQLLPFSFPELRSFWSASGIDPDGDRKDRSSGNETGYLLANNLRWPKLCGSSLDFEFYF